MKFQYEHLPHYLSLGAGVQSSTLALMYATGELTPMPEAAIFADTQAEPQSVYDWLDWLETQLPYEVHRVSKGNLADQNLEIKTHQTNGKTYRKSNIPLFGKNADGSVGILMRGCTVDYKIAPIRKHLKQHLKPQQKKGVQCVQIIGISTDEYKRVKPIRDSWAVGRWPLIEKRMSRVSCLDWMQNRGYPTPPRSSCVFCPYHSNKEWRRLQKHEPDAFLDAVKFDRALRESHKLDQLQTSVPYVHRSCKPLDSIDFRSDVERGQQTFWDDECEGMCGV